MKFRKHFDYDVEKASDEATIPADKQGESLTIQSMSEDADLNVMMRRMGVGQPWPQSPRVPTYGDFSGVSDFQSALEAIRDAEDKFMEFPPDIRARFENDPQKMLEFVSSDVNRAEAEKIGLVKPRVVEAPVAPPAPAVPAAPSVA